MPSRPDPYRLYAFALEVGDLGLAALLARRLFRPSRHLSSTPPAGAAAARTVAALAHDLGLGPV